MNFPSRFYIQKARNFASHFYMQKSVHFALHIYINSLSYSIYFYLTINACVSTAVWERRLQESGRHGEGKGGTEESGSGGDG